MDIRKPVETDDLRPILATAFGGEWDTRRVAVHLRLPGAHRFNDAGAYCYVSENYLNDHPPGTMPVGPCCLISTLSPLRPSKRTTRAQYQKWALDTLTPLVAEALRAFAADHSHLLQRPFYSVGARALVPYWGKLFAAKVEAYGEGTDVIWVPTLAHALRRVAAF